MVNQFIKNEKIDHHLDIRPNSSCLFQPRRLLRSSWECFVLMFFLCCNMGIVHEKGTPMWLKNSKHSSTVVRDVLSEPDLFIYLMSNSQKCKFIITYCPQKEEQASGLQSQRIQAVRRCGTAITSWSEGESRWRPPRRELQKYFSLCMIWEMIRYIISEWATQSISQLHGLKGYTCQGRRGVVAGEGDRGCEARKDTSPAKSSSWKRGTDWICIVQLQKSESHSCGRIPNYTAIS